MSRLGQNDEARLRTQSIRKEQRMGNKTQDTVVSIGMEQGTGNKSSCKTRVRERHGTWNGQQGLSKELIPTARHLKSFGI